jgi:hypothetical protein
MHIEGVNKKIIYFMVRGFFHVVIGYNPFAYRLRYRKISERGCRQKIFGLSVRIRLV